MEKSLVTVNLQLVFLTMSVKWEFRLVGKEYIGPEIDRGLVSKVYRAIPIPIPNPILTLYLTLTQP